MDENLIRKKTIENLEKLISGVVERSEVAAWAEAYVVDDQLVFSDKDLWNVIQWLGAVDTPVAEDGYLYGKSDFEEWVNDLG